MEVCIRILKLISVVVGYMLMYKAAFTVLGFFTTRKFPPARKHHKYAIMIAARNEAGVIDRLLESIRAQDYPSDLVSVFVVADNCTDDTASIARAAGANVYERFDSEHRTKGYAFQFLVKHIHEDYGADAFEAYFIFDADNLLKSDYISRMNDAFDAGERLVMSYRNTKNFADNWISASYAVQWYRTIRFEHRARSVLRLATRIQGTGYLVTEELIRDGWNWVSLTEDRELSAVAVLSGMRISYNDAAEFYDEQPTTMRIALRQRIRWAKGHLYAFTHYGYKLFKGIFTRHGHVCYDMLWVVIPENLFSHARRVLILALSAYLAFAGGARGAELSAPFITYMSTLGITVMGAVFISIYSLFMERERVPRASIAKRAWFCACFPLFDIIGIYAMWVALFSRVEWKTIPHTIDKRISDIERELDKTNTQGNLNAQADNEEAVS